LQLSHILLCGLQQEHTTAHTSYDVMEGTVEEATMACFATASM
jgi:hypothetical protein